MVVLRNDVPDTVSEPDVFCPRGACGKEHLRRRRMGIFLEEVMFDFPRIIDTEAIGDLDLLERVVEQLLFSTVGPRPRQLMLVEDSEFHAVLPCRMRLFYSQLDVGAPRKPLSSFVKWQKPNPPRPK